MSARPASSERTSPPERIEERFPGLSRRGVDGASIAVAREHIRPVLSFLRDDPDLRFDLLVDLAATDHLGVEETAGGERFSLLYHLASVAGGHSIRVKASVPAGDPTAPSVSDLWPAAAWEEREAQDLFGIEFEGNPDPRRLLLPEEYPGFPLRKDHPLAGPGGAEGPAGHRGTEWIEGLQERGVQRRAAPPPASTPRPGEIVIGPLHPATAGALRLRLSVEGDRVASADAEIGFSHAGIEKLAESLTYSQGVAAALRLNHPALPATAVAFALAVEELLGVEPTPRAQSIRVILCELSRVADHLLTASRQLEETAPLKLSTRARTMREEVEDVLEWIGGPAATGARIRIGGLAGDVPPGFGRRLRDFLAELGVFLDDFEGAVTRGASVQKRLEGRGRIAAETAVSLGLSGPCLRASGIPRDVRRTSPYAGYERLELDVLTREEGDAWARLLMRLAEIRQSLRILGQALDDLPPGPVLLESVGLPPKARLGSELEAMVRHFELLMPGGGPRAPLGREVHRSTETASGELGFYALSAGGPRPHRLRVRSPSFRAAAALSRMLVGERLEDVATVVSSLGIVASEVDR